MGGHDARDTGPGPLITIITATFNAAKDLPWTLRSMRAQTYRNIQWIVADGGSTDGTVNLLRQNEDIIDMWFSAPDRGIYDAWNKALKHVKGDWIQFVGAGDELASGDVLEKMAPHLSVAHPSYDIVYGRLQFITESSRSVVSEAGIPWHQMKGKWDGFRPMLPVHPEVFHHHSVFLGDEPFDTSYKIAGDSQFLMRQLRVKDFLYVPLLVDRMPLGGVSARLGSFIRIHQETQRASRELGFSMPLRNYLMENLKFFVKYAVFSCCSERIARRVFDGLRLAAGRRRLWTL